MWTPLLPSRRPFARAFLLLTAFLRLSAAAYAQETALTPATVEEALHQMADAAGVIFVGEVTRVQWRQGENGASGLVEISFRVDEAVRGCTAGTSYKLTEWAGLWGGGDTRYRVGQRLLMMLHAPGSGGVSSPVGGMAGAVPIRATTPSPQATTASATQTAEIADLRWIGTRILRSLPFPSSPVVTGSGQTGSVPDTQGDSSIASQQAPVAAVVTMLRAWQQAAQ